ncbi:MAG TPA: glycosyl hydrolase family 28 protein [Tepidisphaeraceae bacterium]|nr:glycosyl hydrolase family 28 protein [Tepidisphaeraceae bacterium]
MKGATFPLSAVVFNRTNANRKILVVFTLLFCFCRLSVGGSSTFNVREHGALGDGKTLDTAALNKTIDACNRAGGGVVLVPAGDYLTGTVHLKSNVMLNLEAGAQLIGTPDLSQYQNFTPPGSTPLASRLHWHRALILGEGVENVAIVGRGIINGNKVFDPHGEERMRGPHAVLFGNCRNITLRDISIRDAANYAVMLEFTSDVTVHGIKITGGWDGVHFRGWKDNPCKNVSITDCQFYTGDDCIAGWYWENTLISHCIINSSCNGIRLIGPATDLIIHDCLFFGPGRNEHRTSGDKHRHNMLAGICLQPGAWDHTEGRLDGVKISDVTMHDVTTPLHLSVREGNTCGRVTIDRLTATGAYLAAASIESWAKAPLEHVTLRDVTMEFTGGAKAAPSADAVRAPGVDARPLPAWGIYARNVETLDMENVRLDLLHKDARPAMIFQKVGSLNLEGVKVPRGQERAMVLKDVREVHGDGVPTKQQGPLEKR